MRGMVFRLALAWLLLGRALAGGTKQGSGTCGNVVLDSPTVTIGTTAIAVLVQSGDQVPELSQLSDADLRSLYAVALFDAPGIVPSHRWQLPSTLGLAPIQVLFAQTLLEGTLPTQLGMLQGANLLSIANCPALVGSVPSQFGNLQALSSLRLSFTGVGGSLPTQLGRLAELASLEADSTDIGGTLPTQLGLLSKLTMLTVGDTHLSGTVPTQFGNLRSLRVLELRFTQLGGAFPVQVAALPVGYVDAAGLAFTEMPQPLFPNASAVLLDGAPFASWPTVGAPQSLSIELSLSGCGMGGSLPPLPAGLVGLFIADNQLTGSLPSQIGLLTRLTYLGVSNNRLSSTVPLQLALASALTSLDLSGNRFDGTVPSQLGLLPALLSLAVADNLLSGTVPSQLGSLQFLTRLDVSGNNLSGPIPSQIGLLSRLVDIRLADNALTGTIPAQLLSIALLTHASVFSNRLHGTVRDEGNARAVWLRECDNSGLDEHTCTYSCPDCPTGSVALVACDWKGRMQWCVHWGVVGAVSAVVVVGWVALYVVLQGPSATVAGVGKSAAHAAFGTAGLVLDMLFAGASTGTVFALAVTVTTVLGVCKLGLALSTLRSLHTTPSRPFAALLCACSVAHVVVLKNILQLQSQRPPAHFTVVYVSIGLTEALAEGTLQLLSILRGNKSNVVVSAFAFSVVSFCSMAGLAVVLIIWQQYSSQRSKEGGSPSLEMQPGPNEQAQGSQGDQASPDCPDADGPQPQQTVRQEPDEPPSKPENGPLAEPEKEPLAEPEKGPLVESEKVVEPDDDQSTPRGAGQRGRRRLAVLSLCCICTVAGWQLRNTESSWNGASPSPLAPASVRLPRPQPQPRHHNNVLGIPPARKLVVPGKQGSSYCAEGGGSVCVFGELVAVIDSLGSPGFDLEAAILDIGCVQLLALVDSPIVIPTTIASLSQLKALSVRDLRGALPSQLGLVTTLEFFDTSYANDTVTLPSELGQLSALSILRARFQSVGALPSQLGTLALLRSLELERAQFSETNQLPSQLGQLQELRSFLLFDAPCFGTVPSEFGNLSKLTALRIVNAQVSGELPTQLVRLVNALSFELHENAVSGEAVQWMLALPGLVEFDVHQNQLSGPLLCHSCTPSPNLQRLLAANNTLSGTLPTQLGTATALTELSLEFNRGLGGSIPTQLGLLTRLTSLELARCSFEGTVPSQLALLTNLARVSIEDNRLRGKLPAGLDAQVWLRACDYSGIDNGKCARECPTCAFTEFEVFGCNDRGHNQYCLPLYLLLVVVGFLAFGMRAALSNLVKTERSKREKLGSSIVSTVAAVHLVLDVLFVADTDGAVLYIGSAVLCFVVVSRLVMVTNEFLFLESHNAVRISDEFMLFALAMVFGVVDPSTLRGALKALRSEFGDRAEQLRVWVRRANLAHDVPMLCLQIVGFATTGKPAALQALIATLVSILTVTRLWVRWHVHWDNAVARKRP